MSPTNSKFKLAAALVFFGGVSAQAASLNDVLAKVYQTNPKILAERAQLRAVDEGVPQALSGWRPTISMSAGQGIQQDYSKLVCSGKNCGAFSDADRISPANLQVTVTEPLYNGGQTVAKTREANALVLAERRHLADIEAIVFLSVITDYLDVLEAERLLELNRDFVRRLEKQVIYSKNRQQSGDMTESEVHESEIYHAQALFGLEAAIANLETVRANYLKDVGEMPAVLITPEAPRLLAGLTEEALEQSIDNNPVVLRARYAHEAAEANVDEFEGMLLPSLALRATYLHADDAGQRNLSNVSRQLLLQLSFPFYQGGMVSSQVRGAKETVASLRSQIDVARRAALSAIKQFWVTKRAAENKINVLRRQVSIGEIGLTKTREEALEGDRTNFDIINLEQLLFQARSNLLQAEHDVLESQFSILTQIGQLTPESLSLPVEQYRGEYHLEKVSEKWFGLDTEDDTAPGAERRQ